MYVKVEPLSICTVLPDVPEIAPLNLGDPDGVGDEGEPEDVELFFDT
jgi:hypothetical protein